MNLEIINRANEREKFNYSHIQPPVNINNDEPRPRYEEGHIISEQGQEHILFESHKLTTEQKKFLEHLEYSTELI